MLGGSGKTAFMRGEGVGVEHVLPREILHMDEGVGAAHPAGEIFRRRRKRIAFDAIGVVASGEVFFRQFGAVAPVGRGELRRQVHAIGARRRAKNPARFGLPGQRIFIRRLVERGDGADGGVESLDLLREDIAEQAGNAQGDVYARAAEPGQRQNLETAHTRRSGVP